MPSQQILQYTGLLGIGRKGTVALRPQLEQVISAADGVTTVTFGTEVFPSGKFLFFLAWRQGLHRFGSEKSRCT